MLTRLFDLYESKPPRASSRKPRDTTCSFTPLTAREMHLLHTSCLKLHDFDGGDRLPRYAILSHCWDTEEVTFSALRDGTGPTLRGWQKIIGACQQAVADWLEYIWIDTCCIDKSSSAEFSEAINSMFNWYRYSEICYVLLQDVSASGDLDDAFVQSKWHTRGWTLQELLAPSKVHFFDREWECIGSRKDLHSLIARASGILRSDFHSYREASAARKMSWAANRKTTRQEDRAYSLLGLFNVHMSLLYGEGDQAFQRLQRKILKRSRDESLFAWTGPGGDMLAPSPDNFSDSGDVVERRFFRRESMRLTYEGLQLSTPLYTCNSPRPSQGSLFCAVLNCRRQGYMRPLGIYLLQGSSIDESHDVLCRVELSNAFSTGQLEEVGQTERPSCGLAFPGSIEAWRRNQSIIFVQSFRGFYSFYRSFRSVLQDGTLGLTLLG